MAITKQQKKTLIEQYVQDLTGAKNTVIVRQNAINVPLSTDIRKDVLVQEGKLNVVRKRLFMRALKEAGMEEIELPQLDGSIFALYAHENEFGPLKAVNKYLKDFKRINKAQEVTFLWGWFEKKWQDADYVNELANVPTKEELYAKLCYLFNYPLQSFACVLNEVAKKDGEVAVKEEVKEEIKEEVKEAVEEMKEEIKEEIKEEVKEAVEEMKEEIKEEVKEEMKEAAAE